MCYTPTDIEVVECFGERLGAGDLGGEISGGGNGHLECTMSQSCLSDSILAEQMEYLDDLWYMLHHSEDDDTAVLGLTSYLDDSGSDDGSPLVTCGGPLMTRIEHKAFSRRWLTLLADREVEPPLHMKEFSGMGKYAGWFPEFKRHLFRDVARLINDHKLYSISIAVSQDDFKSELSEEVRRELIGPYAFAFFALVQANAIGSDTAQRGPFKTAYLVDRGFGYQDQLNIAHALIVNFEIALGGFRHTGALDSDTDDRVPALQAADVVAWASRKRERLGTLPEGFEPLEDILREENRHVTIRIPKDGIRMFSNPVNRWITKHGSVPKLSDVISRQLNGIPVKLKA